MTAAPLSAADAGSLLSRGVEDAHDYYFSAFVSLVDAIRGVQTGFYSWATVKCYYSVFYAIRALLAIDGTSLIYGENVAFTIRAKAGQSPKRKNGRKEATTHGAVLWTFREEQSNHFLLSQDIGLANPLDWLASRREDCNYREPRFTEPLPPVHFESAMSMGVRTAIAAYMSDLASFSFDPDHAMLAFPLAALSAVANEVKKSGGAAATKAERDFFNKACRDSRGHRLTDITRLFDAAAK